MAFNLLVVEDNPDWRKIWNFVGNLLQEGTKITWATSVSEAESQVRDAEAMGLNFDLIIADIFLSGSRTGLDFFESAAPQYQQRFIFVSSVKPEKVQNYFKHKYPHVHFLQKPFGAEQMVNELRSVLKKCDENKNEVGSEQQDQQI